MVISASLGVLWLNAGSLRNSEWKEVFFNDDELSGVPQIAPLPARFRRLNCGRGGDGTAVGEVWERMVDSSGGGSGASVERAVFADG